MNTFNNGSILQYWKAHLRSSKGTHGQTIMLIKSQVWQVVSLILGHGLLRKRSSVAGVHREYVELCRLCGSQDETLSLNLMLLTHLARELGLALNSKQRETRTLWVFLCLWKAQIYKKQQFTVKGSVSQREFMGAQKPKRLMCFRG